MSVSMTFWMYHPLLLEGFFLFFFARELKTCNSYLIPTHYIQNLGDLVKYESIVFVES